MAEFEPAFEKMILNEGGYSLHTVKADRGGMTYAGISRNFHPYWPGWRLIDEDPDNPVLTEMVREFYRENFWNRIHGDEIKSQAIAQSVFDFAVNAGIKTAVKLAQIIVKATPDGIMGPKTLEALNAKDEKVFVLSYALMKITRYAGICNRDRSQTKFLLGWVNRTLEGLKNV